MVDSNDKATKCWKINQGNDSCYIASQDGIPLLIYVCLFFTTKRPLQRGIWHKWLWSSFWESSVTRPATDTCVLSTFVVSTYSIYPDATFGKKGMGHYATILILSDATLADFQHSPKIGQHKSAFQAWERSMSEGLLFTIKCVSHWQHGYLCDTKFTPTNFQSPKTWIFKDVRR